MAEPAETLCGLVPTAGEHGAHVVSMRRLAQDTYAVRIRCPEIACRILPGQFFMIRPAGGTDPLLGRPFALYDTIVDEHGCPGEFEFAYHVVGKLTNLMTHWEPGEPVKVWGPLGNGFPVWKGTHLLCVGGGIGYTPFLAVARETLGLRQYGNAQDRYTGHRPAAVTLAYGVQSRKYRADLADFLPLIGLRTLISTDDGSEGRRGFVTGIVEEMLELENADRPDGVYCCGPEAMMRSVAKVCEQAGVPCWLSLESPMACGFGACFSCVTKVKTDDGWDYRRTCVEGPIFEARALSFAE